MGKVSSGFVFCYLQILPLLKLSFWLFFMSARFFAVSLALSLLRWSAALARCHAWFCPCDLWCQYSLVVAGDSDGLQDMQWGTMFITNASAPQWTCRRHASLVYVWQYEYVTHTNAQEHTSYSECIKNCGSWSFASRRLRGCSAVGAVWF